MFQRINKKHFIIICLLVLCATTFCKKESGTRYINYVDYFYNALKDTVGLEITSTSYIIREQAFVQETADGNNIFTVQSGVKNKKLWVGVFQEIEEHRYKTVYEWNGDDDIEPLSANQKDSIAYSTSPYPYSGFGYIDNSKLFIVDLKYENSNGYLDNYDSYILAIDKNGNHNISKTTSENLTTLRVWYNNHYYIWNNAQKICINTKGETMFELKSFPSIYASSVSVEEGIELSTRNKNITRNNFKLGKTVWQKPILFANIPNDASFDKRTITEKSDNIWTYQIDITLYTSEGDEKTKRSFTININTGEISYL